MRILCQLVAAQSLVHGATFKNGQNWSSKVIWRRNEIYFSQLAVAEQPQVSYISTKNRHQKFHIVSPWKYLGVILGNYLTGNKHSIYLLQIGFTIEALSSELKDWLANSVALFEFLYGFFIRQKFNSTKLWKPINRIFYQSFQSQGPVNDQLLVSLWMLTN